MILNILTLEDLERFKKELIEEMRKLLAIHEKAPKLIKGRDVCKMLNLSPGKLKNLRDQGKIEYVCIGRSIKYELKGVLDIIERNKKNKGLHCFLYGLLSVANLADLVM